MKRVVVNGTFDVLHRGHVELLRYAKSIGDFLLVCIDDDNRVSKLKGPTRPVFSQDDRKFVLQSLSCVNAVKIFHNDSNLIEILEWYSPHIMVKGSDYIGKEIVGSDKCGSIIFFERMNEYSTTKIVEHTISR